MNVPKKLDQLKAELREEGLDVELLCGLDGVTVVGKYADRCLARASLKSKGVTCAPVIVEEYEGEVPQ